MEPLHSEKYKGHTISIYQDENPFSPAEDCNTSAFLVYDHRQFYIHVDGYNPTDIFEFWNKNQNALYEGKYRVFPVYAHIHSGVSLSLSRGSDRWDTSFRGFILVERMAGWSWRRDAAYKVAENLIAYWNQYLYGEVYGYVITDGNEEEVDSCWGYYRDNFEEPINEARSIIDYDINSNPEKYAEQLTLF